ncbi:MAG TPA: transposase, partial [Aquella sp.]|nr:transposase [Aquella sp.]
NYIYIEKPPGINNSNLCLIEINPLYDGTRFKINFSYKVKNTSNKPKRGKVISIDPGMTNLFVIHDPHGEQFIIKGYHIKNINNSYNKRIDICKKKLAKYNSNNRKIEKKNETLSKNAKKKLVNNIEKGIATRSKKIIRYITENGPVPSFPKQGISETQKFINHTFDVINKVESGKPVTEFDQFRTSKKLRKLCLDRHNQINNYFNHVCNWIINKYSDCETIIIGNNKGWKNKCNMGKKTNRNFYAIPYRKLFDKLIHKAEQNNQKVCIIGEAYTSKCDALAFEKICHHDEYSGKRTKRGLFASSTKKYLNADLNGAINIMRKWYTSNNLKMKEIKGENIYNPKCVPLLEIMKWN